MRHRIHSTWLLKHRLKNSLQPVRDKIDEVRNSSLYRKILLPNEANGYISEKLERRDPVVVARLGSVEARLVGEWRFRKKRFSKKTLAESHMNAGIYPVECSQLERAAEIMWEALNNLSLLARWNSPYQSKLIRDKGVERFSLCNLADIEPWRFECPWSRYLEGRRVLVVHPFTETIKRQYERRDQIFKDKAVLPNFSLDCVNAPVTNCGLVIPGNPTS